MFSNEKAAPKNLQVSWHANFGELAKVNIHAYNFENTLTVYHTQTQ
jgi:hypothetical protein